MGCGRDGGGGGVGENGGKEWGMGNGKEKGKGKGGIESIAEEKGEKKKIESME